MKKILPLLIVLIAIGGSGFAAMTLRGGNAPEADKSAGHKGDTSDVRAVGHGEEGGEHGEETSSTISYFKFQRDFIIPVMRSSTVDSIVLLSINIEMEPESIELFRSKEPRIRDAFMRTLLQLSHEGMFAGDITDPAVYTEIQARLNEVADDTLEDHAGQVLIVDFARQDH